MSKSPTAIFCFRAPRPRPNIARRRKRSRAASARSTTSTTRSSSARIRASCATRKTNSSPRKSARGLTASPSVRAININIETFHGNVYLMGTARSEHELQRAAEIASVVRGVRRVVSFMQVRAPPQPYYAQAPQRAPNFAAR